MNQDEIITKSELARRYKVTPRTINAWMQRLNLPHVKVGRVVRFDWEAVRHHLERNFGRGLPS